MEKFIKISILSIVLSLVVNSCIQERTTIKDTQKESNQKKTELKGPYLGMIPPGDIPVIFAPGVVSSIFWEHSGAVFSPDGNELFWSRAINEGRTPRTIVTLHMRQVNGVWTKPELAPFNTTIYTHVNSISPDGNRLYYYASDGESKGRLWIIDKTEKGWSEPRLLNLNEGDSNTDNINEVQETRDGDLYFDCTIDPRSGKYGIAKSKIVNGKFTKIEPLNSNINFSPIDKYSDFNSTMDPDEEFIIFVSRRPGGYSGQNLYISFTQEDNEWGEAINLGPEINKPGAWNSWPHLSPDGKYLFFTSRIKPYTAKDIENNKYSYDELEKFQRSINNGWANIYWVNTSFIEKLRPLNNN